MKKYLFAAFFAVVVGAGVMFAAAQNDRIGPNSLLMQNVEALAQKEENYGNCGGYRNWATSGFLQRKREFYDCTCQLRQGYDPEGTCN